MLRHRQQTKWLLTSMFSRILTVTTSSLRRPISTSVKKVTRSNFEATLKKLRLDVRESDFIAIDLEMTGVTSAPWRESFPFDDFEVQYLKLKDSAEKFGIMQFGVCPFRWDHTKKFFVANPLVKIFLKIHPIINGLFISIHYSRFESGTFGQVFSIFCFVFYFK